MCVLYIYIYIYICGNSRPPQTLAHFPGMATEKPAEAEVNLRPLWFGPGCRTRIGIKDGWLNVARFTISIYLYRCTLDSIFTCSRSSIVCRKIERTKISEKKVRLPLKYLCLYYTKAVSHFILWMLS